MKNPFYTPHELNTSREAPKRAELGDKKYKEMISRDKARSQDLPFQFSAPKKTSQPRRDKYRICDGCENLIPVHKNTAGIICVECKKYNSVNDNNKLTLDQVNALLEEK